MVVAPFPFDAYTALDLQESGPDQHAIAVALRDGIALMPADYRCTALGVTADGDFLAMRFGIYRAGQLVGALWLGGHVAGPGHTYDEARVYARICPGPVPGCEAEFWKPAVVVEFVRRLLVAPVLTREGGSVQLLGVDYAYDPEREDDTPGSLLAGIDAAAIADPAFAIARTPLATGGFDHRVTLAP
jgi:hypothetical protein